MKEEEVEAEAQSARGRWRQSSRGGVRHDPPEEDGGGRKAEAGGRWRRRRWR